jgi:hypothetical protein
MAINDLKISFPDGNIVKKTNSSCYCPNLLSVDVTDLVPGKRYTVFISNLNDTLVRTFPESFSFVAKETSKRVTFYYQFVTLIT